MEKTEFFSAFDKALPTHVRALYTDLLRVYNKADSLFTHEHECDCEYCDIEDERNIKFGSEDEYRELRAESLEIADTLRRCISWAKFKGIELADTEEYHINLYTLEEL